MDVSSYLVCFIICLLLLFLVLFGIIRYFFRKAPAIKEDAIYDYAIVLGCPTLMDGSISPVCAKRCDKAIQLYEEGRIRKIIVSGAAVINRFEEAEVMYQYLCKTITVNDIYKESKARNTYENIYNSIHMIRNPKHQQILFISSPYHLRRIHYFAKRWCKTYAIISSDESNSLRKRIIEVKHQCKTLYTEYKLRKTT